MIVSTLSRSTQQRALRLPKKTIVTWVDIARKRRTFSSSSSSSSSTTRPWNQFLSWYTTKLDTHPLLTKGISSGIIAGLGDLICQTLIRNHHKAPQNGNTHETAVQTWDVIRTLRFTLLGAVLVAPCVHLWYSFLAKRSIPLIHRVVLDQLLFSPVFLMAWLTSLWTLEGFDPELGTSRSKNTDHRPDFLPRLLQTVPGLVVANWALWVPAQAINFGIVPLQFQVLFSNVVALLWNCYLSYCTTTTKAEDFMTTSKSGASSASS